MNIIGEVKSIGTVGYTIEYKDGRKVAGNSLRNTVLDTGKAGMANTLGNFVTGNNPYFITRMIWGNGGTLGGTPKYVDAGRDGLFGITQLIKPVIASLDSVITTQVVFTSVMLFDDINGATINEMALQMSTGDLYSMVTFGDLIKTSDMQITWNWTISMI